MGAAVGEWSRLGRVEIWDLSSDQFPGGQGWYYMIRRLLIGRIWGDKANEGWDQEEEKHEVGLQHFLPRCYSFWSLILAILFYPPPDSTYHHSESFPCSPCRTSSLKHPWSCLCPLSLRDSSAIPFCFLSHKNTRFPVNVFVKPQSCGQGRYLWESDLAVNRE